MESEVKEDEEDEEEDIIAKARALNMKGNIYLQMKKYAEAVEYQKKSLDLIDKAIGKENR